jgi:hypothetical protein
MDMINIEDQHLPIRLARLLAIGLAKPLEKGSLFIGK